MLIAEELLLLVDDESGKVSPAGTQVDRGLAGAVLVELAELGLVDLAGPGESVTAGRVVLRTGRPPDHSVLRAALARLADLEGVTPGTALDKVGKGLRQAIVDSLVGRGALRREDHKVLGVVPTQRIPGEDDTHGRVLRARLGDVLTSAAEPDRHTAALISLLHALGFLTKVVKVDDERAARSRAESIADGNWAGAAVRRSVAAVTAAVLTAIVVSGTTDTTGTEGSGT
jgi:hypothetical protein